MITYDLHCSAAHGFEGWFRSHADYQNQLVSGQLLCPFCGDNAIEKQLSAPNIGRKSNQIANCIPKHEAPESKASGKSVANISDVPAKMAELITELAKVQNEALKDSRWVGRNFAEEARAIHYGETSAEKIHGEATPKEASELAEEGVTVTALMLPIIPYNAKN
jgi:hypothetical protein